MPIFLIIRRPARARSMKSAPRPISLSVGTGTAAPTVTVKLDEPPPSEGGSVTVIVAVPGVTPVTERVAQSWPAGIVIVGGTEATPGFELVTVITVSVLWAVLMQT